MSRSPPRHIDIQCLVVLGCCTLVVVGCCCKLVAGGSRTLRHPRTHRIQAVARCCCSRVGVVVPLQPQSQRVVVPLRRSQEAARFLGVLVLLQELRNLLLVVSDQWPL